MGRSEFSGALGLTLGAMTASIGHVTAPMDEETLTNPATQEGPATTTVRTPCATIALHPDLSRVGERCFLLRSNRPTELSRTEGQFVAPGGGTPRALLDPYLSREPLEILARESGELRLSASAKPAVRVDGQPLNGELRLPPERLQRGVIVELASRVLLLLHQGQSGATEGTLSGASPAVMAVQRSVERVADLDVPVLLRGETGVGKDRVARAIHARSGAKGPYVAVNLATLDRATAVSRLFGHVRGAFTGAERAHRGHFEAAEGGTLFLDEIGELTADVQPMLLRVLETREIRPLGAESARPVRARVVAATDADLSAMAEAGKFRPALLHRLSAYEIWVPPLRERREDIPRLVVELLRAELEEVGGAERMTLKAPADRGFLHRRTMERLLAHAWPGNVRQLRNVVRQLAVASLGSDVAVVDEHVERALASTQSSAPPPPAQPTASTDAPSSISDEQLMRTLEANRWAFGPTARALGLNRTTFYRLVEKHPGVRKGTDLAREELTTARAACDGDLDAMSAQLQVSRRAIRLRLKELGLD
ncbi:MAG: hypothetical protein SangKO_036500 [Sandaracinaceae bacterium]